MEKSTIVGIIFFVLDDRAELSDLAGGQLALLMLRAAELVRIEVAATVADFDLPLPLARAVLELAEPIPMRDLAASMSCDRSYITGMADGLEERGLVERVPGADRRVKLLTLTPAGRQLREELLSAIGERSDAVRALDSEARLTLARTLTEMAGHAPGCPLSVE